jgi:pyridoxamine 5'-phosphate oxidase
MATGSNDTLRAELRNLKVLQGPFQESKFEAFPPTPHEAFRIWLREAIEAGVKEPHAMTLSTTDEQGWPDARVLILKNVDERGWHFAIKSDSPKGCQLRSNEHVALTFYWPQQGRQIRLRGKAIELSNHECSRDFADRPLSSKIGALGSRQSQVLGSEGELLDSIEDARQRLEREPDIILPGWKVYAVDPFVVEYWQGASSRLHQRLQYKLARDTSAWEKNILWP